MQKRRVRTLVILVLSLALPLAASARSRRVPRGPAPGPAQGPSAERIEQVRQAPVVVVAGSADHMDHVLSKARQKFVVVRPAELPGLPLHSQQVLMVNCRGVMSAAARDRVRRFVAAGGFLYTTDHAVRELIEKIFPQTIAFNGVTSTEATFPMEVHGKRGLLRKISSQQWQLAGGGYMFKVLDKKRVQVLMSSKQVAHKYKGGGVLGVRFRHEDGTVIHVTGHFYTQPGQRSAVAAAGRAFEQLSANVVAEKQGDNRRVRRLYSAAPKRAVTLRAAPSSAAAPVPAAKVTTQQLDTRSRVRVLERKKGFARVRDDQGNEGWVDGSAL